MMRAIGILFVSPAFLYGWTLINSTGLKGWQTTRLAINVNYTSCTLPQETLNSYLDEAIKVWNGHPTTHIKLERAAQASTTTVPIFVGGTATDSPLILCDSDFANTNQTSADVVPAATRIPPDSTVLTYGGILLNAQSGAGAELSQLTDTQVKIVLAHEIGHLLGLGHSGQKEALMYFSIAGKTKALLTQDDIDGMTYLYPRNEFSAGAFGCGAVHTHAAPNISWFFSWSILVLLVAGLWVRRFRPARPL